MDINTKIADVFLDIADGIETGKFGGKNKIALTTLGSEYGAKNLLDGAVLAKRLFPEIDIVLIGSKNDTGIETLIANTEEEMYKIMEEKLDSNEISACVTMHYNFPIGVSTVGRVITPASGKDLFVATTTGTSSMNRVEGMVKNAIYGIIAAKASGIQKPTVGILNVDGARTVEKILKEIASKGYDISFGASQRSDGGTVLRGNDILLGSVDVAVTDSLTGNILMKMFSSFTSGGQYETIGYGYGPGIGENYNRNILILSRASGVPVIANALKYAFDVASNNIQDIAKKEFEKLNKLKWLESFSAPAKTASCEKEVAAPEKTVVTESIAGIDIMELETAVQALWKKGIYAESGMGCTGPIVLVSDSKLTEAKKALVETGFISEE